TVLGDAKTLANSTGVTLVTLGKNILTTLMLVGTMFYMDPLLSTATLVGLPLVLLFFRKQRKHILRRTKRQMQETGDLTNLLVQSLHGVREVKAYRAEGEEVSRLIGTLWRSFEFSMQAVRTQSASGPITQLLAAIGIALAIWYGGYRGITGTMTPGEFMGFVTAAMLLYPPVKQIGQLQTVLTSGLAAASRVLPIIDNIPEIRDREGATPLNATKGSIKFEDVSFAYDEDTPALKDVSFEIRRSERVAFVGPSGAGK
ncbi:MAG: ABC transporter transmembrane domain-containing protein, partial [Pseudomonadota bacterium]